MSIASSIFLVAAGAILRYAVNVDSDAISIPTIGLILMICGGAGLAFSLLYELMQTSPRRDKGPPRDDYVGPDDRTRRLR
jgi:hypothetical protein